MAGIWLGSSITGVDTYLPPIIPVVMVISLIPVALELRKMHRGTPDVHAVPDAAGSEEQR